MTQELTLLEYRPSVYCILARTRSVSLVRVALRALMYSSYFFCISTRQRVMKKQRPSRSMFSKLTVAFVVTVDEPAP